MSCGLTNDTVVHQGPSPPALRNQSSNCEAIHGSARTPWNGPPLGDGKVPPEKPHGSSVEVASERCHLPHQLVWYPCSRSSVPQVGNPGSSSLRPVIRQPVWWA